MPNRVELRYSRNQVKQAGKVLRRAIADSATPSDGELREAIDILDHWRACHSYPLQKATMGLRSRVASSQCGDPRVSQRLKRRPTIIDKLAREPSMQLTTMQDIGGCRAVLADINGIKRVQRRWTQTSHRVTRVYDYLSTPKPSGYRGVHVIVTYDGFQIEVQLRTRLQHAWGTAIERVGPEIGADLKSGDGPEEVLRLFRDFGDLLAQAEGLPTDGFEWGRFNGTLMAVEPPILALVGLRLVDGGLELVVPS